MSLPGKILACFVALNVLVGCGEKAPDKRGTRVGGVGLVTLDGEPLQMGRIVMIADQGNGKVKAAAEIHDGVFEFTKDNGPLEGKVQVEIHPAPMDLEDFESQRGGDPTVRVAITRVPIPRRYYVDSKLTAVADADTGIVPVNFDLVTE